MSFPSVYEHIPRIGWRLSAALRRTVRASQLLRAGVLRPDCIYLERGCLHEESLVFDRGFRRTTQRLVLDVDDGIFLEFPDKVDKLIAMSDHLIASNEPIADYLRDKHEHITIIPTAVPLSRFRPKAYERAESLKMDEERRPVVGWIGTIHNMPFLSECAEALRVLAERVDYDLYVVAPSPEPLSAIDLTGVNVVFRSWEAEREIEDLHRMDVGLMPLPEGREWMRYKAATKLVQYLSVGIPAVASPIGVNATILSGDRVGFAATNTEQWLHGLDTLLASPEMRRAKGAAGRKLVEEKFSVEANAPRFERVLAGTQ